MTTYKRVPVRDAGIPSYRILRDDVPVGDAVKTGTHLDDYPWHWMVYEGLAQPQARVVGVAATLRSAVDYVKEAVGR